MKLWEIEQAKAQIIKIRCSLNDNLSPPDEIKRPRYESGRLFPLKRHESKINKLKILEKRVDNLAEQGLLRWLNRVYLS